MMLIVEIYSCLILILQSEEAEKRFVQILQMRGFVLHPALPDGNCLFRSVADQMYGDQSFHDVVREATMNWMVR